MTFIKALASYYRRQHLHLTGYGRLQPHPMMVPRLREIATLQDAVSKPKMNGTNTTIGSKPSLPAPPPLPQFSFYAWAKWAFGSILTLVLPFWDKGWRSLLRLEGEVEMAAEAAEHAADVVEKVATATEKMAADAAGGMKEDGMLKDAALLVERVSKEVAEEAHLAKDIIHKVEDLKEEVETLMDPIEEIGKLLDKHEKR